MNELPAEVLRCQVDSLRDALVKVLDTREKEAKTWLASHNAKESFSDRGVKEEREHLAAMNAASDAEREARVLLATLKTPNLRGHPYKESRMNQSAEQQARDMLERMGVEDAQSFTAGDLVELANLIADNRRLRTVVVDYAIACGELSKGLPADDPMWAELRALGDRIPKGSQP